MDGKKCMDSFMAGLLERIREITIFLNPTLDSYKRLGSQKAPRYISWSPENRSQLIRIPGGATGSYSRMELRSPDPKANPYLAFALIMIAGLEGIEKGLKPPESLDLNLYTASYDVLSKLSRLPDSYAEAAEVAAGSEFVRSVLPEAIIDAYTNRKER